MFLLFWRGRHIELQEMRDRVSQIFLRDGAARRSDQHFRCVAKMSGLRQSQTEPGGNAADGADSQLAA